MDIQDNQAIKMKHIAMIAICAIVAGWSRPAAAQVTIIESFNPESVGSLCGIGHDSETSTLWLYPCFGAEILVFTTAGEPLRSIPRPGEEANDVDIDIVREEFQMNGTTIPGGTVLFINGETGPAEIYAIDPETGTVLDTLTTSYGVSHVVGGSYHPGRGTFFLIQDNVPGAADRNRIAEVDAATGDTLRTYFIEENFNVSYGDLDVSDVTGHLFLVSSLATNIAEFTAEGEFVAEHALPIDVTGLSGLALDCANQRAWASSTSGLVYHLGQVPCGQVTSSERPVAAAFHLSSPYPNPSGDDIAFTLEVSRRQHVHLAVFDLLGRQVETVFDGVMEMGTRTFDVDPDWPAGLYLIRATGEGAAVTQRVVRTR